MKVQSPVTSTNLALGSNLKAFFFACCGVIFDAKITVRGRAVIFGYLLEGGRVCFVIRKGVRPGIG